MLTSAQAAISFGTNPARVLKTPCHTLDFNSYSRARNAVELIKNNNPDLTHANFGGKYLLLQIPYMMGSDWLIANCETGAFLKEVLSGEIQFKPDSLLVQMIEKSGTEWRLWTGDSFIKAEEQKPETRNLNELLPRYRKLMDGFPAPQELKTCSKIDFNSYFRAQSAKDQILKRNNDLSKPNFGGEYLVLKVELLFETIWLIADCKTGRFFPEFLSGSLDFDPHHRVVIKTESSKSPEVYLFHFGVFIRKPDSTLSTPSRVENEIRSAQAEVLSKALPNPDHHSKIYFSHLKCGTEPGPDFTCAGLTGETSAQEIKFQLSVEQSKKISEIVSIYGNSNEITQGTCFSTGSSCTLYSE